MNGNHHQNSNSQQNRTPHNNSTTSIPLGTILLEPPVDEDLNHDELYDNNYGIYNQALSRNISWEYRTLSLTRVPGYGFGIAVSGGSDNPHFANGDPAIAISDVLKGGPAEGKLNINDRIITANGIKLENVDYGTAVQVLRDSGPSVSLIIKRRIIAHNTKITLNKLTTTKLKHIQPSDYGVLLTLRVYIKESKNSNMVEGDEVVSINGLDVAKLFDFRKGVSTNEGKLVLGVVKQNQQQQPQSTENGVHHNQQQSYDSTCGNLYVQPPTRRRQGQEDKEVPLRPPLPDSPTPPPPPPPNPGNYVKSNPNPRFINFLKKASSPLGLKLVGGNHTGVYIGALQPQTPASNSGLLPGDRILRVNDTDFTSLPRETAVATLSSLKPDALVSFIVKQVENYRELLANEKYHDLIHYRLNHDTDQARTGEILLIYDTLSTSNFYEGYVVNKYDGKELRKIRLRHNNETLTLVRRVKVGWARPVVVISLISEYVYECLLGKSGGRRRFRLVNGSDHDVKEELKDLKNSGVHALCFVKDLAGLRELADFCPVVLVVKTDDQKLIKKCVSGSAGGGGKGYSSLLRSFNKTPHLRRASLELSTLEQSLGSYVDDTLHLKSGDNVGELVGRKIEEVLGRYVGDLGWVGISEEPVCEPPAPAQQKNYSIPNYNIPPPYSVDQLQTPLPLDIPQHIRPPTNNYAYNIIRQLAHSPLDNQPAIGTTPISLAPQIDRSKKPTSRQNLSKPIPPPKPSKIISHHHRQNNHSPTQTYLNLPLNSKILQQSNSSAFAPFTNVTSGSFSYEGGCLVQRNCAPGIIPIEVIVPEGAIPRGREETIWFQVLDNGGNSSGGDFNGNLSLMSPLIKFGPENLRFLKPIEIRIPQYKRSTNAKVLMNSEKSWSRVDIQDSSPTGDDGVEGVKIVSLTLQKF